MGNVGSGKKFGINGKMAIAARMQAEGKSEEEIRLVCFGAEETPAVKRRNTKLLSSWRNDQGYQDYYRRVITELTGSLYSKAFRKISEQIDSENPWVAQNAAREVLARYTPIIMGQEDKSVTVRIEGMPTMGTPTDDLPEGATIVELPPDDGTE